MYLGYQNNKIVFYTDQPLDVNIYNLDKVEETDTHYNLYEGEYITDEELAQKEAERIAMLSLTKREVFLALYQDKQITPEQIKAQITSPEALIEFEYATEYYRGNPLIDVIGAMLGYSKEDLDYLFEHKELPKEETNDN